MKIRYLLICFVVSLNMYPLCAQTKGVVVDAHTMLPLAGVNIYFQTDTMGLGITNNDGQFDLAMLKKRKDTDLVVFSYVGYRLQKLTVEQLRQGHYLVHLGEFVQNLDEVKVRGRHAPIELEYFKLSSLPVPLYSFASFASEGKLYVVAGDETFVRPATGKFSQGTEAVEFRSSKMYIYDIETDSWTVSRHKFVPRSCHKAHLYNNRAFILGGKRYSTNRKIDYTDATMEVYDLIKDTVYVEPLNPHQAVNFTSVVYQDNLYLIGGSVKERVYADKVHALNLKTGHWYELGTIPEEMRREMNGFLVDNDIYFLGGRRSIATDRTDRYNLLSGEWKQLANLPEEISYPALATDGSFIYMYTSGKIYTYNIKTGFLERYYIALNVVDPGLLYWSNKLYIIGGCMRPANYVFPLREVYVVDTSKMK